MSNESESREPLLSFGASGEKVRDLQQRLIEAGYALPKDELAESFFGEETQLVVRRFQVSRRLKEDGIVGYQTLSAIVGILMMTEAVLGPFWAWIFLDENLAFYSLIGGSIILFAVFIQFYSLLNREKLSK